MRPHLTCSFPNNFWGWGGEDDELRDRLQVAGLFPPLRPDSSFYGSIVDLEEELKVERGACGMLQRGLLLPGLHAHICTARVCICL